MNLERHRSADVIVIDDLWVEVGLIRPLSSLQPVPALPIVSSRPWRLSLGAMVLTVLLHLVLGFGMFTNFGGMKVPNSLVDRMAPEVKPTASGGVVSVLILIDDAAEPIPTEIEQVASVSVADAIQPVPPEPAPPVITDPSSTEGESAIASSATGAGSQPRTLEDIYMGQIKARIERAWSDSQGVRMAVGHCQVSIQQGKQGEVKQVGFGRCFATDDWKNTLAQAIRYASPLPAPPDEKVFLDEVSLEF